MCGSWDLYEIDYLVYAASDTLAEEQIVWDLPIYEIMKRLTFKKFDSFIEKSLMEIKRDG